MFLTKTIKQVREKRKEKIAKMWTHLFWLKTTYLLWELKMPFQWQLTILLPALELSLFIETTCLITFSSYLEGTSVAKWYTEEKSIFLMVRWLCHLSWHYRLLSINICVFIKNNLSSKHRLTSVRNFVYKSN